MLNTVVTRYQGHQPGETCILLYMLRGIHTCGLAIHPAICNMQVFRGKWKKAHI